MSLVIICRDGWNGDGLAQSFDKGLGEAVDSLEIGIELRSHVGRSVLAVDVRPGGGGGGLLAEL